MRDLLDMAARHADAAELYIVSSEAIPATFEMNKLKHVETRRMQGVALRVIRSGRIGFSSSTDTSKAAVQGLISAAADSADMGEPARFDLPGPVPGGKSPAPLIYDDRIAELDADALIRMGQETVDIITEYAPFIKCSVQLERKIEDIAIANSNLGGGNYRKTTLTAMVEALVVEGNDILDVFDMNGSCCSDFDHQSIAHEVLERVKLGRRIAEARTGRMPVLFTHRGIMPILMALQSALSGKTALEGASPLAGRIGQQVMDPRVCVCDDPTVDWALGSCPIDDEGVESRKTPLIEAGIVKGFYYDLQTAGRAGASSTGNGFRRAGAGDYFEGQPTSAMTNAMVAPGSESLSDMIASIDDGIIVDQVMGAGQGNILTGDFSVNVHLGFKVEKGEIVGRVKDTMVAGNAMEALNSIAAISDCARWAFGEYSSPAFLFRSLGVAAKGR